VEPRRAEPFFLLALVALDEGPGEEAASGFAKAAQLMPAWADAHLNLAIVLERLGRRPEATDACRKAVQVGPQRPDAWNVLGTLLDKQARLTEAADAYRRALQINPRYAEAASNLGNTLKDLGLPEEALAQHRLAVELNPALTASHDNLLMSLNYQTAVAPAEVFDAHRRWGEQVALVVAPLPALPRGFHVSGGAAGDKIRVGYVSPDFKDHPVAWFIEPLLRNHDGASFEVTCYSDVARPDAVTARFEKLPARWRPIAGVSDEEFAARVRADAIDVLVDLAGHTANNRLGAFARRPAPVQITYLGYPNTTGLPRACMRYRITDALADPPGATEGLHTEELIRLPETFLCYGPPTDAPPVAPPPSAVGRPITFGSFNAFAKVNPDVIRLWSRVLSAVPGSRLVLKTKSLNDQAVRAAVLARFAAHGVGAERLAILPTDPTVAQHLARYTEIDVALDPFPYHGTTTTCEALWMGVPVVTLAGRTHASRVGVSLVNSIGLASLVATDEESYVRLAAGLAGDATRLTTLRGSLRGDMSRSALTDAARATTNLEQAYRTAFRRRQDETAAAADAS
jgi:predicted O-linked N-acetylglucosamine transferase (SPINDLY family)